ncbi:MAG: hypothetical protein Kow00117_00130 [Phototrophicales bacterium]|nr:MAG: hypothetical protein D6711_03975 [Chloroflexota bacterium]
MSNIAMAINEAFLNQLLKPEYFQGEKEVASVVVRYQAEHPPYFELPADDHPRQNFVIMLDALTISVHRKDKQIHQATFSLQLNGSFRFEHQQIDIVFDQANVRGGGRVARNLLNMYLNRAVIPAIKEQIVLPDLSQLVGFEVNIDSVQTHHRMLFITMHVTGDHDDDVPNVIITHTNQPSIFLSATGGAITASQRGLVIKQGIDEDTNFPLPMGISFGTVRFHLVGYVALSQLKIDIQQSVPICSVDYTASAGIRVKFTHMGTLNLALSPTITPPAISLNLQTDRAGTRLLAAVQVNSHAIIGWRIPFIPAPVRLLTDELMSWVDACMGMVIDAVDTGLRTVRIPIFSLDALENALGCTLHFKTVQFRGNSVVVHVIAS